MAELSVISSAIEIESNRALVQVTIIYPSADDKEIHRVLGDSEVDGVGLLWSGLACSRRMAIDWTY